MPGIVPSPKLKLSDGDRQTILLMLPNQDSNLDRQNQNLLYYHYTIVQLPNRFFRLGCKNKGVLKRFQN